MNVRLQRPPQARRIREGLGIAVNDRERACFFVAALFRTLKALPHADRDEGQEHGIDDADDR
ncbi:MAG: hypothetical protein JO351_02605 [Candidatus Eremiobacteraeota bacterium]|nr:hypothetical protein [Candidatus Eremiobacteraeota bacterium]